MAEWRTRYKGYGVKIYWHVETNAVSIYSQLKNYSASEAAAMIEGLIPFSSGWGGKETFVCIPTPMRRGMIPRCE